MNNQYFASEQRVLAACNISALAREFDVSAQRLRARFHGRQSRSTRHPSTNRLDESQEAALIRWIDTLDAIHAPPTAGMVEGSANAMIRGVAAPGEQLGDPVGKMWAYNFIKRLPDGFNWVKQKPAERERIEAEDISILQAWYDRLEPLVKRISPSNIYNFDETGFALGQGKPQKVISRFRERTRILSGERGELLTGIECVAADGLVMEPYFVAPGSVHLER